MLVGLWASASAGAASWAGAMFDELSKDFGAVPRGPTLTHPFRFTNKGQAPMHIGNVRVSCGCVSAAPSQNVVAPGESAVIHVHMDTRRFLGHKYVTVYVQFSQPAWDEVRLGVQANGRDDVSVTPDTLALGKVKRGSSPSATATVSFLGHSSWQVTEVERESNFVLTEVTEQARQGGEVRYELKVSLRPDTPVGRWYSDLWVKTNNPAMPRVRVPLTVEIESGLTIVPAGAAFGQVSPGAEVERRVIIRGAEPFRITDIMGADDEVRVQGSSLERRLSHVLTVKLRPQTAGQLNRSLRVLTDLNAEGEIEVPVVAEVTPQDQAASK